MIKWEQYIQLSAEDQKEYDWKFKDRKFTVPSGLAYVVILLLVPTITMLVWFITLKEYASVGLSFQQLLTWNLNVGSAILIVWVLDIIYNIVTFIYWKVKEKKWLRERSY